MANKTRKITWLSVPEDHDYDAAGDYLSLIMAVRDADDFTEALRKAGLKASIAFYKAKDLLRASQEPLLPADNKHVRSDLDKIAREEKLSPVLLVRGSGTSSNRPLIIADGYHRVCAAYWTDENTDIPAVIV